MIRAKGSPVLVVAVAAVAATFLVSGVAHAQDQAAVEKIIQMNKKALEDYDTLEWESAKRTLLEALVAGKKAGLDNHPIMARTYVHLGAVYISGLKDRNKGLQSFVRALEIDPTIRISKAMSAPELEDVFAEALKQAKPGRGGAVAAAPPPPPPAAAPPPEPAAPPPPPAPPKKKGLVMEDENAPAEAPPPRRRPVMEGEAPPRDDSGESDLPVHINALDCPTPDDVPPEKAVKLKCAAAANLGVTSVFLLYRIPGSEEFGSVEMEKTSKGWFVGKIPKKAVTGKSVQFYFEGRNAAGKAVVSNGRSDSPNLILISEGAAAKEAAKEAREAAADRGQRVDTEENPLDEDENRGPRLFLGKVDKSRIGLDVRYGKRTWWIGLGVGSGYGYAKGDGLEARYDLQKDYVPGLGWAGLGHLAPEIGYQVTPDFAISIVGRNQWIPQGSKYSKFVAHGAQSVLGRLYLYSKQSQLRFFGALQAGAGEGFRFVLYPDSKRPDFKDTVRGGPYLAGAALGMYYEMSHSLSFVMELSGLAGFPEVSYVGDVNVGLQLNLY
jgi:hypothetical protein